MQWTVRKRFGNNLQFDLNYTWSKSIDIGSYGESFQDLNTTFTGLIQNAWNPAQSKAVSDYDTTHLFSAFVVAELPFGKGRKFLSGSNRFLDALVGGWQLTTIWRQSSAFSRCPA